MNTIVEFLLSWREMGWAAALVLTFVVFAVLAMLAIALCVYFSEEKREMRAMRRIRRRRHKAFQVLLSTQPTSEEHERLPSLLRRQA